MADLLPALVSSRLARLRELWSPLDEAEARRALEPVPDPAESFDRAVTRRLEELRALCDLASHLHAARRRDG